jgi:hypothetical protein
MAEKGEVQLLDLCASLASSLVDFSVSSVSSSSGRSTFLRLHRRLLQVARPSSGSVIIFVRSLDLPPASSSSSSGRSTSLCLRRRLRQVTRPRCGFIVALFRSLDLPPTPSSSPSGCSTLLWLHRRLHHVARPSSSSVVMSLDLPTASSSPSPVWKTSSGFYIGNEGLPVGCVFNGPAKYFWVLGRFRFETFLRSACLEWLCQTLAAMQDIWMSLHSICSRSTDFWLHHRPTPDIATSATTSMMTSSFDAPFKDSTGVSLDTGHY